MNFGSHTDGVVAATRKLVNVATPGERQGRPYMPPSDTGELASRIGDALRIGSTHGSDPTTRELPGFVEVAEAARVVFEFADRGDFDAAAQAVNRMLRRYVPTPELERHDGQPWHLHFHGPADADRTGWGGGVAVALATVLGSDEADRLGVCAAPACDRVFVDVSRNGTRRFCGETCQNRVKAAAHRARQRA